MAVTHDRSQQTSEAGADDVLGFFMGHKHAPPYCTGYPHCGALNDRVGCSLTADPMGLYYCTHSPGVARGPDEILDWLITSIQNTHEAAGGRIHVGHHHSVPLCPEQPRCDQKSRIACYLTPDHQDCICVHEIPVPLDDQARTALQMIVRSSFA